MAENAGNHKNGSGNAGNRSVRKGSAGHRGVGNSRIGNRSCLLYTSYPGKRDCRKKRSFICCGKTA